eukprot:758243-Ditylum_brightwellii.AAC.1
MMLSDTIKVSWDQPDSARSGFKKKIKVHLDNSAMDHPKKLHGLFGQHLHRAVATKWTAMVNTFPMASQMAITFQVALKAYFGKSQ